MPCRSHTSCIFSGSSQKLRISGNSSLGMSGDIYFRNNLHKFSFGVSYNFFDVILGIKSSITLPVRFHIAIRQNFAIPPSTYFRQLGILLYFYSPALVLGEVPVEGIHIVKCQQVYVFFYELNGKEVAAHIEVHAPVAEAGFILDAAGRQ